MSRAPVDRARTTMRLVLGFAALVAISSCMSMGDAPRRAQPTLTIEGAWDYKPLDTTVTTITIAKKGDRWMVTGLYESHLSVADASARHIHLVWEPSTRRREEYFFELSDDGQSLDERYVVTVIEGGKKEQSTGAGSWRRVRK